MGIFDFLKKLFSNKEVKEPEKLKLAFSDVGNWAENKEKEINVKEKEVFALVKQRIDVLDKEIEEKITALKNIDIESKKAEDNAKSVTGDGRKKYIEFVDSLVNDFNNLKPDRFEKLTENINRIFLDFDKRSRVNYERATVLIGKEMADLRDQIRSFSNELAKIFDENKDILESSKAVSDIKLKLKHLEKIEKDITNTNESIKESEKKIIEKEEENKKILSEIEEIKKTPEYIESLAKSEKLQLLKTDLEKDILDLRKLVDFKSLASFYHIFEDKMRIINSYNNEFLENFNKDSGESILNLLNQAKLNTENISNKINEIRGKKEEIAKNQEENEKNKDKAQELSSKLEEIIAEITNSKNSKSKEEKRAEKLNINKESAINEIKKELEKIGVEITINS